MFDFLGKLTDPWKNITASSIGLAALVIAVYGKSIGDEDISIWLRAPLFTIGLAVLIAGYLLTWKWAWDTKKTPKEFNREGRAVAGVVNIVGGALVLSIAVGAMALNWDIEKDPNVRADFAKAFGAYVDALGDDDPDALLAAQMSVFAECKSEDEGKDSDESAPSPDLATIQTICEQLLKKEGVISTSEASTILAQLTQPTSMPTPQAGKPTSSSSP